MGLGSLGPAAANSVVTSNCRLDSTSHLNCTRLVYLGEVNRYMDGPIEKYLKIRVKMYCRSKLRQNRHYRYAISPSFEAIHSVYHQLIHFSVMIQIFEVKMPLTLCKHCDGNAE